MKKTPEINKVVEVAREAMNLIGDNDVIENKQSSADLLTETDLKIEKFLIRELKGLMNVDIIAEESGKSQGANSEYKWIIDPIDGTTNFVHGFFDSVAISIALWREDVPLLGVVANVGTGDIYEAEKGSGAYLDIRQLKVSEERDLNRCLFSTGFPYDYKQRARAFKLAEKLAHVGRDIRRRGSATLDVINVAEGKTQAYFEIDVKIWDIAAAALILEEAGGKISYLRGQPINSSINQKDVLASSGLIHKEVSNLLLVK